MALELCFNVSGLFNFYFFKLNLADWHAGAADLPLF